MQFVRLEQLNKRPEILGSGFGVDTIVIHDDQKNDESRKKRKSL